MTKIPIRTSRQLVAARLAAYFGNEEEFDSDSYGSNYFYILESLAFLGGYVSENSREWQIRER